MATINRKQEVVEFLESLANQSYKDFELIVVDQNDDDILDSVISEYKKSMNIIHLKSKIKGLSHARNIGIKYANGEIVAFPDDDCIYPEDLLENVFKVFSRNNTDIITVKQKDYLGNELPKRFNKNIKRINMWLVWTHVSSIRLFFRKKVIDYVGFFDEELGVGEVTKWKGSEDIDLPIRALKNGFSILFVPDIYVFHKINNNNTNYSEDLKKVYDYSMASGYVMRKHGYSIFFLISITLVTLLHILIDLFNGNKFDAYKRILSLKGRFHGYTRKYY